jgi:aminoglycoside phosphotransferase
MFEEYTGAIHRETRPPQGGNYEVELLETEQGRFIVKTGDAPWKIEELEKEARVLTALAPYHPGAPSFLARHGDHFLLTYLDGVNLAVTVADGEDAAARRRLAAEHGRFLRRLHSWTPDLPCPADWLADAVRQCAERVARGEVSGLVKAHSAHAGRDIAEVLDCLRREQPKYTTELVFGHGDWCLPNSLVQGDSVTGAVDWSWGGYADYRFDLATGLWSLRYNLGDDPALDEYLAAFLDGYGYGGDIRSLAFFEAIYAFM